MASGDIDSGSIVWRTVHALRTGTAIDQAATKAEHRIRYAAAIDAPCFLINGMDLSHVITDDDRAVKLPASPMLVAWEEEHGHGAGPSAMVAIATQVNAQRAEFRYASTIDGSRVVVADAAYILDQRTPFHPQGWRDPMDTSWVEDHKLQSQAYPAIIATQFLTALHSGRITYGPAVLGPRELRRFQRKPQQRVDYRVLTLPDGTRTQARSIGTDGPSREIALHSVRGHFATYTHLAPMFGKYAGTFWKGPTVRGNPKHGEVVKDYAAGRSVIRSGPVPETPA